MKQIVVAKRFQDYHAAIKGDRGRWGRGETTTAAIGDLILSHPECFDIKIVDQTPKPKAKD